MSKQSKSTLFVWAAAVALSLAVLAVFTVLGMRAQKEAALTRARDEARILSASQAEPLSQRLKAATRDLPRFSDPPVPREALAFDKPRDQALDGTDLRALENLRDDPEAGLSPAGLPRRALAALRIQMLAPARQEPGELLKTLTVDAPSVLTLPALRQLQSRHPEIEIPEAWQLLDKLDELKAEHPDGGWITFGGQTWWISADGRQFLSPSAITTASLKLPSHASARLSSNGKPLTTPSDGEILSSTPLDFPSPLNLEWVLSSPEVLAANVQQQTRWTLALAGIALLVSAIGLWVILRALREERRLGHLKGQFVASVSHELRAPIGSIRLMAEALEAKRVDDPAEFHQLIGRESERLSHLIENVLDFARIEEGVRHYRFEEHDLSALIADTVKLFDARASETRHAIRLSLDAGTAVVDRSAIQQVVVNLLDNALKFSPAGTVITVQLTQNESTWSLVVTDDGPGVPESERERIFERFHRLGDELRRETKGTGIGLSLVRHIAKAHGGTVGVTNHPTTFTLTAPIHPPAFP